MAVDRRRGRRDNGLDGADFVPAGDLDPRVGEHLLDVLGARGIAAYLQPTADINPVTRHTTIPARPTDRLYVDRRHLDAAREYLRRLDTEERVAPLDVDATFAGIVADFHRPSDPTAPPWPAAEDVDGSATALPPSAAEQSVPTAEQSPAAEQSPTAVEPPAAVEPPRPTAPVDARQVTEPSLLAALDTFGANLPDESTEGYTPPPPPPLPRVSAQAILGLLAIVAGFVLLLGPDLFPLGRSTSMLLGFAAILGGATALILRLRPGTDDDDHYDPDDGARV